MKKIRLLIVEDDPTLIVRLEKLYREIFTARGFDSVTVETVNNASEAKDRASSAKADPYDLVSLDVHLGEGEVTGLDVLTRFKRYKSAWMVVLLTGVETDLTANASLGKEAAEKIRRGLRKEAYANFPSERLLVVEKPSQKNDEEREKLLANRLRDIAGVYEAVSRLRYVFRPIEVDGLEYIPGKKDKGKLVEEGRFISCRTLCWQVRFNCGDMRTIPHKVGYKSLHKILSLEPGESVTPEELRVIEPPEEKTKLKATPAGESTDAVAAYFEQNGIDWKNRTEEERENLIKAALAFRFKRFVELREFQEDGDIEPSEENELARITDELGPLAEFAEIAFQRLTSQPRTIGGDGLEVDPGAAAGVAGEVRPERPYTRRKVGWGLDSVASGGYRKRRDRTANYLREEGFVQMADEIEKMVDSTGSNWSYLGQNEWNV